MVIYFFCLLSYILGPLESLDTRLYSSLEAEAATLVWALGVVRLMREVSPTMEESRSLFQTASDHQDVG